MNHEDSFVCDASRLLDTIKRGVPGCATELRLRQRHVLAGELEELAKLPAETANTILLDCAMKALRIASSRATYQRDEKTGAGWFLGLLRRSTKEFVTVQASLETAAKR